MRLLPSALLLLFAACATSGSAGGGPALTLDQALAAGRPPAQARPKAKRRPALAAPVSVELQAALVRFGNTVREGRRAARPGAKMPATQAQAWSEALAQVGALLARPVAETAPSDVVRAGVVVEAELESDAQHFGDFPKELALAAQDTLAQLRQRNAAVVAARVRPLAVKPSRFRWPVAPVVVTSGFGARVHPISGDVRPHKGVDLLTERAQPIYAPYTGAVVFAGWHGGHGNHVELQHDAHLVTRFSHLTSIVVEEGEVVRKGQIIGTAGETGDATGVHLHFELARDGAPLDPELELPPIEVLRVAGL